MDDNSYELVINDSPLADIFLVKYAQDLSKESIIIYLWLNMTARKSGFDDTFIKKFKIVPDSGVDGVLSELMSHSLIIRKGDMFYLQDLKRQYVARGKYAVSVKTTVTELERNRDQLPEDFDLDTALEKLRTYDALRPLNARLRRLSALLGA